MRDEAVVTMYGLDGLLTVFFFWPFFYGLLCLIGVPRNFMGVFVLGTYISFTHYSDQPGFSSPFHMK